MTRKKRPATGNGAGAQSTNGLTESDAELLREKLALVERATSRHCLLGGNEAHALFDVKQALKLRLDPPSAPELAARADKLTENLMSKYFMQGFDSPEEQRTARAAVDEVLGKEF
ncbi:MAG: hypothetical protein ACR2GC_10555 [Methyloceanibacter sp.]|uniref:hypothetical protein n=1 Tax=Methyloceanibacter sp. TaxID=1965321 RepID=UPI003D9BC144